MQFDLSWVRAQLPARRIDWFETIDSTMRSASELAAAGCPDGTIVGAEQQTAGIGRLGRQWLSARGEGLWVSWVLRRNVPSVRLPLMMLALGLATRDALVEQAPSVPIDLRWPNDVLIGHGNKCAGVLAHLEGDVVIAGIGINVSQPAFPENLETPAASLAMLGTDVRREHLLVSLVHAVDRRCGVLISEQPESTLRAFEAASSFAIDRRVTAEADGRRLEGVTLGLDSSGFLRVREDSGRETTIFAGGVRPL